MQRARHIDRCLDGTRTGSARQRLARASTTTTTTTITLCVCVCVCVCVCSSYSFQVQVEEINSMVIKVQVHNNYMFTWNGLPTCIS